MNSKVETAKKEVTSIADSGGHSLGVWHRVLATNTQTVSCQNRGCGASATVSPTGKAKVKDELKKVCLAKGKSLLIKD